VSLLVSEFICLKSPKFSTASTEMIRIEVGSSIPYIGFHSELSSSLKSLISEPGFTRRKVFLLYRDRCAIFQYFDFLNRWVSLNEREFTYSKFQQIINTTTYIHTRYGRQFESLSRIELHSLMLEYRINLSSRKAKIVLIFGQKLPFHCIGAR
jgi:hypothetical protein